MLNRKNILPFLLIIQIIILKIASFFPEWIEHTYSNGLYPYISNGLRILFGWIPFSIGDLIYFIVIFFIIRWFLRKLKKDKTKKRQKWKTVSLEILSFFSIFYFLFHLLWATNYHRIPLFEKMKIQKEYSDADLLIFTKKLITKTNSIHSEIVENDSLKVTFPYSQQQVFVANLNGYKNLYKQYSFFKYENLSIKKSLMSLPLTYMGFAGYLNPFTNEAQVNDMLPMPNSPTTAAHEMAHQLGYASESEANFIGFLASIKNDNPYYQYSGYSFALKYCLRNWKIRDEKVLEQLLPTIHPGILKNYDDSQKFWEKYETFIETGFKVFYDNFLKFNQQKEGLDSYSKFVDLMVNYYKKEPL